MKIKNMKCTKNSREDNISGKAGRSTVSDFRVVFRMNVFEKSPLDFTKKSY